MKEIVDSHTGFQYERYYRKHRIGCDYVCSNIGP